MLDKTKTDEVLGKTVNDYLKKKGVQTPMLEKAESIPLRLQERTATIEHSFKIIMQCLNLDLTDDSLRDTPERIAKMFVNEIFWGLKIENFPKITAVENKMKYDEMIVERNIKVSSACEHHFVGVFGKCHVAYIPNKKVLGLSKMNRVVEYFSRRPQIQERLTEQIYYALSYILETEDVAVIVDAEHFCVKSRGIEDVNSSTVTSKLGGLFRKNEVKSELMNLIRG